MDSAKNNPYRCPVTPDNLSSAAPIIPRQRMKPEGRTANEIVANKMPDAFSGHFIQPDSFKDSVSRSRRVSVQLSVIPWWNFFQAVSWLDLAKRTQSAMALHYAAFHLRYGIEYLLFELLVLTKRGLTEQEYQKCLGDPKAMKKALRSSKPNYDKRAEFTRILHSLTPRAPKLHFWKLNDLFHCWGIASEFLHFVGAYSDTYASGAWIRERLARLEGALAPTWETSKTTSGLGLIREDDVEPEVRQAWLAFAAGTLKEEDLKTKMRDAMPILAKRAAQRAKSRSDGTQTAP
jgi:hypothetical protein